MNFNKSFIAEYRILVVSDGNVNNVKSWSGTNYHFYAVLKKQCHVVGVINCNFRILELCCQKGTSVSPIRYITECAKICKRRIQQVKKPYDFILQLGGMPFLKYNVPYALYLDNTFIQWLRINYSWPLRNIPKKRNMYFVKYIKIEKVAYKRASRIFTLSKYIRKSFIQDYGVDSRRVIAVGAGPNILRLPTVDKDYDGKTILFIGKDIFRKGGNVLLKAFKKVKEKIPDAKLIVVSSHLKKLSKGKNLEGYGIIIKKFADKKLLGFLYRRASVFVMPSVHEAFGIVFLEAMAYKLPCIGTNIEAMPEIIEDGKTGFVVRPNDPDKLAEKIIFILKHRKIARQMGERGRQRVERYYNWDNVAKRVISEMGAVISKTGSGKI